MKDETTANYKRSLSPYKSEMATSPGEEGSRAAPVLSPGPHFFLVDGRHFLYHPVHSPSEQPFPKHSGVRGREKK